MTPSDPKGQNWRTSLEKRINSLNDSVFLAPSAQASPNCPVPCPGNHHYFVLGCGWGRLKERDIWDLSIHEWAGTWMRCPWIRDHGMWNQSHCEGGTKQELRTWQLALPVWTTSIFIAFENAIMSVISTDYTTFFIVCINRHGMMELQLM